MKNTVVTIQQMKEKGEKISMLTAYDYSTAKLEDEAGVNTILVGDSLGNVILGYEDTISVKMCIRDRNFVCQFLIGMIQRVIKIIIRIYLHINRYGKLRVIECCHR